MIRGIILGIKGGGPDGSERNRGCKAELGLGLGKVRAR